MSFRLKIVLGLILIQVLLVIMLIWSSLHFLRISNEVELSNRAFILAPSLASLMRPSVLAKDHGELQREINTILLRRNIVYIRVRNTTGAVLAEGGDPEALARPFVEDFLFENVTDNVFDVSAEIEGDEGALGRVELGISTLEVNEIMAAARREMATIALSGLGISILFSLMLGNYFTRQLTRLRDATRRIASGDIGYQLAVIGSDELAQTASAFNTMSRKLATLYSEKQAALNGARQKAHELHESQRRIHAVLDHAMDAIFTFDENGVIETFNPAAERIFGVLATEAIGERIALLIPEPYLSEHETYIKEFLRSGDRRLFGVAREIEGRRQDGSVFPLEIDISEVRLEGRHLFIAIARDITERKKAEAQLHQAQESALESSRNKFEFIANVSHEIRAPVSDMLNTLNVLGKTQLSPEQHSRIEDIQASGDALITIINDMLDFSRIEAGKLELESIDFDLRRTIDVVYQSFKDKAAKKGINLAYVIPSAVPSALRGDPTRLRQLIANLIDNAIKFTDRGEITMRVTVAEETGDHAVLRFEVEDTGIGIAPNIQQRIFEIFARSEAAIAPAYSSSGLGLMICKRLAEMMSGRIGVHSEVGRGSTFWFTAWFEKPLAGAAPHELPRAALANLNALVINPDKDVRASLQAMLIEAGMRVRAVEDGMQALNELNLAVAHGQPYDVAIFDMMVSGMNGIQFARAVHADKRLAPLRMIMLAATGYRGDSEEVRQAGIHCYLTAPVERDQLLDCVAAVMAMREGGGKAFVTRYSLAGARPERYGHALVISGDPARQKHLLGRIERLGYRASLATNAEEALDTTAKTHYDLILVDNEERELLGADQIRRLRDREQRADHRIPIVVIVSPGASRDEQQAYRTAGANACFTGLVDIEVLNKQLQG